jgi:hypothetical protein
MKRIINILHIYMKQYETVTYWIINELREQ